MSELLEGRDILIVDDEYLIALDMSDIVESHGGNVVGPAGRLDEARRLIAAHTVQGAILDINLGPDCGFPLADELMARNIPIVLATGYDPASLPDRFAAIPVISKPPTEPDVSTALRTLLD